jgi:succinate-semialdehyde dehydrogenase/glutarate-semialdehyde dehydrogenase
MPFVAINPENGQRLGELPNHSAGEVQARITAAHAASRAWRQAPLAERADTLRAIADRLDAQAEPLARLMADEMGKPFTQGVGEAKKCAWACRYYAEHAPGWLAAEPAQTEAIRSYTRRDALGVILAIMPWNFPFWQVFRFASAALMAGNTALIKHAPNTPYCGEAIETLLREAGAPPLLLNLRVEVEEVGAIIADDRVAAVTLTGSTAAGQAVGALAARHLKRAVLELGGSDPCIILADADLDRAATVAAASRLLNNGQSCIAAKRFLVERAVAEDFTERFAAAMASHTQGPPRAPETKLGPMARLDLRDAIHRQVLSSVAEGAVVRLGGQLPEGPGFWYPATLLTHCQDGMRAWDEETFGPVAALRVVDSAEEAVELANRSPYGLGAALWTADRARAETLAGRLECGAVFVNELVKSDPRLPFGGVKRSGYGRELGQLGLYEFVNHKGVWVS